MLTLRNRHPKASVVSLHKTYWLVSGTDLSVIYVTNNTCFTFT